MAKRSASSDLNQDNWDHKDEVEDAGKFTPLNEADLQERRILKARRSVTGTSADGSSMNQSPFAKFSGFSSSGSSPIFAMKMSTSSLEQSRTSATSENTTENGSSVKSHDKVVEGGSLGKDATKTIQTRSIDYYRQLQSLNESVLKWMQLHLAKNSCCDFTPVFNDYKNHINSLNVTFPVLKRQTDGTSKDGAVFKMPEVSKNTKSKEASLSNASLSNSNATSIFNKEKETSEETAYGSHFKSNTTNTSTFSSGIKSTPPETSSNSPLGPTSSSKEALEVLKPSFFASTTNSQFFSFLNKDGQNKSSFFSSTPSERSSETGEEQEYVPPKNEFVAVAEDEAFYTKRCKLFFKKGESFTDKGVGSLHLKKLDGRTQLLIRADTSLGNILLNIMLSESLPTSRTGKNNVLLVCVPNPPLDGKSTDSQEAIPMLIRVKTGEDADELLETLNKHKS